MLVDTRLRMRCLSCCLDRPDERFRLSLRCPENRKTRAVSVQAQNNNAPNQNKAGSHARKNHCDSWLYVVLLGQNLREVMMQLCLRWGTLQLLFYIRYDSDVNSSAVVRTKIRAPDVAMTKVDVQTRSSQSLFHLQPQALPEKQPVDLRIKRTFIRESVFPF